MSSFKTKKGTELPYLNLKGKDYLQVAHRLVWFREEHPNGKILTEAINLNENFAIFKATIELDNGNILGTAHGREDQKHFPDYMEKSETKAIGRALALCGFGTQFAPELEEGERLADAPIQRPTYEASKNYVKNINQDSVKNTYKIVLKKENYIVPMGKNKGKKLAQCSKDDLQNTYDYLHNQGRTVNDSDLMAEIKCFLDIK